MGGTKRTEAARDRQARLEQVKAEQRRTERRRSRLIIGGAIVLALALVVPTAVVLVNEQRRQDEVQARAEAPIEGVNEFEGLGANHVTHDVDYDQLPPVGGDHHPTWQNCGFYREPVRDIHAVHSLEHGAVWITYDPALGEADVATLEALTRQHPYLLVSPYEGLPSPVVASAWGLQIELEGVADERLEPFLVRYLQGPQTPEPGASCMGGVGT